MSRGTTGMSRQPTTGVQWWAVLVGWVAAVLAGLVTGPVLGAIHEWLAGSRAEGFTVPALAILFASAFVAYLVGGYTAGKLARYSGGLHGALTAVVGFVAGAVLVATHTVLGATPPGGALATPLDAGSATGLAAVGGALFLVSLAGGYAGGRGGQPSRP
jgi:hypothetical protein